MSSAKNVAPTALQFQGYLRPTGLVGTRNYIGVLVTVNCAATAARHLAEWYTPERLKAYPNIDGVVPFIHELGCGMEKSGEPMDLLRRSLGGSIRNPNLAGAVVLGLGCERNNLYAFLEQEGFSTGPLLHSIVLQEVGGTANAISQGKAAIDSMLPLANATPRSTQPLKGLRVGLLLQTHRALPEPVAQALAQAIDALVDQGGTVVLTDTPRLGPVLQSVASSPQVQSHIGQRLQWWDSYTAGRDTAVKPLSSVVAALPIRSRVQSVIGYGHEITQPGVVMMDGPGYEAVAATGQFASGVQLICVVSDEGSVFGANGAPTVKLATHHDLYARMPDDFDLDAGLTSAEPQAVQALAQRILQRWIEHAGGRQTCSEDLGVGQDEFVPWPIGVMS